MDGAHLTTSLEDLRDLLRGDAGAPCCLDDATSSLGLAQFQRLRPSDWHELLWQRALRRVDASLTVGEWLRGGAGGDLMPRAPTETAWQRRRSIAAQWVPYVDTLWVGTVDEAELVAAVQRRLVELPPRSSGTWTKACSLLRRWIVRGQQRLGVADGIAPAWDRIPMAPPAGEDRHMVPLDSVHALLVGATEPDMRVMVGLAVGARLLPMEFLGLRHRDVDLETGVVTIRKGSRRGLEEGHFQRQVHVPRWVVDLMREAWPDPRRASGWAFPDRLDAARPARRVDGRLARLAKRIGRPGITFTDLRRLGQGIARAAGGARATVRGVVPSAELDGIWTADQSTYEREQRQLARAWKRLAEPPARPAWVPARAPKGCGGAESELDAARRRVAERFGVTRDARQAMELPASCRWPGDAARAAKTAGPPLLKALADADERARLAQARAEAEAEAHARADARITELVDEIEDLERRLTLATRETGGDRDRVAALEAALTAAVGQLGAAGLTAGAIGTLVGMRLERGGGG